MADPTGAERQRRFRARQRAGIQLVTVKVDQDAVENLLALRLLRVDDMGDVEKIATAIERLVREVRSNGASGGMVW